MKTRVAVRTVVLSTTGRVLLMKMDLPWLGHAWTMPGGGVKAGEEHRRAARRELREETGFESTAIGPEVLCGNVVFEHAGHRVSTREHYFLVNAPEFEPTSQHLEDKERAWFLEYRWWSVGELESTEEVLTPPEIARLTADIVEGRPPYAPLDFGTIRYCD